MFQSPPKLQSMTHIFLNAFEFESNFTLFYEYLWPDINQLLTVSQTFWAFLLAANPHFTQGSKPHSNTLFHGVFLSLVSLSHLALYTFQIEIFDACGMCCFIRSGRAGHESSLSLQCVRPAPPLCLQQSVTGTVSSCSVLSLRCDSSKLWVNQFSKCRHLFPGPQC